MILTPPSSRYHFSPSPFEQSIFGHLGKKLTSLRLHQREQEAGIGRRQVLDIAGLQILGQACPRLRSLGLDLECNCKSNAARSSINGSSEAQELKLVSHNPSLSGRH